MAWAPPPKRPRTDPLPPGWTEHFDDRHNAPYWHHEHTGETTWNRPRPEPAPPPTPPPQPPAPPPQPEWEEIFDDTHRRPYWHNLRTGETTWNRPPGLQQQQQQQPPGGGGGGGPGYGGKGPPQPQQHYRPPAQPALSGALPPIQGAETGRVAKWDDEKGYGFVTPDSGAKDILVHRMCFGGAGRGSLVAGQPVYFHAMPDHKKPGCFRTSRIWGPGVDMGPEAGQATGRVSKWDDGKGYGFITPNDGARDILVHREAFGGGGQGSLLVGHTIYYTEIPDKKKPGFFRAARCNGPAVVSPATGAPAGPGAPMLERGPAPPLQLMAPGMGASAMM